MATFYQQAYEQPVRDAIRGGIFYDNVNSGLNALGAFSPVTLGSPTDVANAITAGVTNAVFGSLFVPAPITSSASTQPLMGVAMESTYSGKSISVCTAGVFPVLANGAMTAGALVFATASTTRTNQQTPFTNIQRMLNTVLALPNGITPTVTYDLVLCGTPAVSGTSSTSTVPYYPLGIALSAATAQYDLVPVQLSLGQFWA